MNPLIRKGTGRLKKWPTPDTGLQSVFTEIELPDNDYGIVFKIRNNNGYSGEGIYDYDKAPILFPKGMRRVVNPLSGKEADYLVQNMVEVASARNIIAKLVFGLRNKRVNVTKEEILSSVLQKPIHICEIFDTQEFVFDTGGAACSSLIQVGSEDEPIVFHFEIPESTANLIKPHQCTDYPRDINISEGKSRVETFLVPTYNTFAGGLFWIPVFCSKDKEENKELLLSLSHSKVKVVAYSGQTILTDDCPISIIQEPGIPSP